jgi:DNA-binding MarR family transcriptional regulator
MTAGGEHQPSADNTVQFLRYLEEIVALIVSMPPELTEHLRRLLADRRHSKEPSLLAFEPPILNRMATILYGDTKPTMGELSRALSRPLSTVSRIISMLEEYGYVQRLPDSDDGRVVRVALTDVGRQLYEAMRSHEARSAQIILDCLTVEERIILLTLLGKVAANLNREA